jgi:hypothetical protein
LSLAITPVGHVELDRTIAGARARAVPSVLLPVVFTRLITASFSQIEPMNQGELHDTSAFAKQGEHKS